MQFNCTITPCNYTLSWFIAGRSHAIKNNDSVPGLVIRKTVSMCTSSNQETHFLELQATEALNNSAFYCAANQGSRTTSTCRCGADGRCFSKSALLRSKPVWDNIQYGFSFQFIFQVIACDINDSGLISLCLCSKNYCSLTNFCWDTRNDFFCTSFSVTDFKRCRYRHSINWLSKSLYFCVHSCRENTF